jgi:hypothetical protein
MEHLKILGLAAVAATALIALIGPSSAAASGSTALCKANETPCAAAKTVPAGTTVTGRLVFGTKAIISGSVNVECARSTISGPTGGTATPVVGTIVFLTFTECVGCKKVTAEKLPYSATITHTGAGHGTLTIQSHGSGSPTIKLQECPFGLTCGASTFDITLDIQNEFGGEPRIKAINEPLTMEGFGCGSVGTLNATYQITSPFPVFISS